MDAGDVFQQRHENGHSLSALAQPESITTFYGLAGCLQAIPETEIDRHGDTFVHTTISTALIPTLHTDEYQVSWIGFDHTLTGTSMLSEYQSTLEMTERGYWTPPNRVAKPMRLRDQSFVPAFIDAAREIVERKVEYSNLGLIVFSLATAARMLPACELREDLLDFAYAQDACLFVDGMGNCSSVLGEAVEQATGAFLHVTEPAPPSNARVDETIWMMAPILDALTGRFDVTHAGNDGQSEMVSTLASAVLDAMSGTGIATLDLGKVSKRVKVVARQLMDLGCDDALLASYIVFLESSLMMVTETDRETSIKVGRKFHKSLSRPSRTYLASPAMLRRALLAELFCEGA